MNDPSNTNDDNAYWPANYLQGEILRTASPGDEVEYTIYFLSNGSKDAAISRICDLVPTNTTFFDAFSTGKGIRLALGSTTTDLTNANDTDQGQTYTSTEILPSACSGSNVNGAVLVNVGTIPKAIGSGNPSNSYGFVRFRVKVN